MTDCLACPCFDLRRAALDDRRAFLPLECSVCQLEHERRWWGVSLEQRAKPTEGKPEERDL